MSPRPALLGLLAVLFLHPLHAQYRGLSGLVNKRNNQPQVASADPPRNVNKLSGEEQENGWTLLFDGSTLSGWHSFNKTYAEPRWEVRDGTIHLKPGYQDQGAEFLMHDLTSDSTYTDFDLKLEWKIAPKTITAVYFHTPEGGSGSPFTTSPEVSIVDPQLPVVSPAKKNTSGSLSNLYLATPDNAKPPGKWNELEIICKGTQLQLFQNGQNIVTATMWSDEWNRLVATGFYSKLPGFGVFRTGKIDFLCFTGEAWFTNIKIKRLDAPNPGAPAVAAGGNHLPIPPGAGDLSGMWEGQQTNGNLVMYYSLGLVKTGENTYAGFDSCTWVRNSDNSPLNVQGAMPHAKKVFLARVEGDRLICTELGNMQHSNWGASTEIFKLQNNGGVRMVNGSPDQPNRHFNLLPSGQPFPDEYRPYLVNDSTLGIEAAGYSDSRGAPILRYNDQGKLTLTLQNRALIPLSGVKANITVDNADGIRNVLKLQEVAITIRPDGRTEVAIPVSTNFLVTNGIQHWSVALTAGGRIMAQKDITLRSDPFFKTDQVSLPEPGNARMKAVAPYYGFGGLPFAMATTPLGSPTLAGDKLAQMWRAVFLNKGYAGFKLDETEAANLARQSLDRVESSARQGEAEGLYLMSYACQMGLEGPGSVGFAKDFLKRAADAGFGPAMYDEALLREDREQFDDALDQLLQCYHMGMKKAAISIGHLYEVGNAANRNTDSAIAWYQKGISFGDPAAMNNMALICAKGFGDNPPDINKTLELLSRASDQNYTNAMINAGMIFLDGNKGKPQNIPTAIRWFRRAADLGSPDGMFCLGICYMADNVPGLAKDVSSGIFWLRKGAEAGSTDAMKALAAEYLEGTNTEKDVIRARYWYNQAVQMGAAQMERKDIEQSQEDMANFWRHADFSPSTYYVQNGRIVGDSGPDVLGGIFGGVLGSFMDRYSNLQQQINGLEFMQQKNGYKIYGGTVSGSFISNLMLKQGQTVYIHAYGIISTGMFSGSANADGLDGWDEYKFVPSIRCSSVMTCVKDAPWQFIGQSGSYTAPKDGALVFALNGKDYMNYKGYFDLVIALPVE